MILFKILSHLLHSADDNLASSIINLSLILDYFSYLDFIVNCYIVYVGYTFFGTVFVGSFNNIVSFSGDTELKLFVSFIVFN